MFFTDIFFSVLAEKTFLTVINDILDHFLPFGVTFFIDSVSQFLDYSAVLMTADPRVAVTAVSVEVPYIVGADSGIFDPDQHLVFF
jgi:hypothetical protein